MTTQPMPPSAPEPKPKAEVADQATRSRASLSRRLGRIWLVSFVVMIPVLIVLSFVGWTLAALSGAGRIMEGEEVTFLVLFLLLAFAGASLITIVVAIPLWIFQRPVCPETIPSRSWVDVARHGDSQGNALDAPRSPLLTLVWPLYGLGCLLISIALGAVWLFDADLIYLHWEVAQYLPYIALIAFVAGLAQPAWKYWRRPRMLAQMGWRLRLASAVVAACFVLGIYSLPDRETPPCSGHLVQRLIELQNLDGFQRYLALHPVCRGLELNLAMGWLHGVARLSREEDAPAENAADKLAGFMTTLLDNNLEIKQGIWSGLMADERLFQATLQYLAKVRGYHPAFSAEALGERLGEYARENDIASLKKFFDAGLRLDRGDWISYAPHLRHRALNREQPAWPAYELLVAAGLREKPEMATLIKAIRQSDVTPLVHWRRGDWLSVPEPDDRPGHSLLGLAILYADDARLRQQFLALSGMSAADLLARTPLPARCDLGVHLGADRVLASLSDADDQYQRASCVEYMEALSSYQKAESGRVR